MGSSPARAGYHVDYPFAGGWWNAINEKQKVVLKKKKKKKGGSSIVNRDYAVGWWWGWMTMLSGGCGIEAETGNAEKERVGW